MKDWVEGKTIFKKLVKGFIV